MTRAEAARSILQHLENGETATLRLTTEGLAEPIQVDRNHPEYTTVVLMLNRVMLDDL